MAEARTIDLSLVPEPHGTALNESFRLVENTFDLVDKASESSAETAAFVVEYKPVHAAARQLNLRIKGIDNRLDTLERRLKRIRNNPDKEAQIEQMLEDIGRLEAEKMELEGQIPAGYADMNGRYKELAKADKINRAAYRRNVDAAYEPLQNLLEILNQRDQLEEMRSELLRLQDLLAVDMVQDDATGIIEEYKLVEARLSGFKGINEIKTKLSKTRRALKGEEPDVAAARSLHAEALTLFENELEWRSRASALHGPLDSYDNAINGTIGLRLQRRLTEDMAEAVAGCLSEHRDISLNF